MQRFAGDHVDDGEIDGVAVLRWYVDESGFVEESQPTGCLCGKRIQHLASMPIPDLKGLVLLYCHQIAACAYIDPPALDRRRNGAWKVFPYQCCRVERARNSQPRVLELEEQLVCPHKQEWHRITVAKRNRLEQLTRLDVSDRYSVATFAGRGEGGAVGATHKNSPPGMRDDYAVRLDPAAEHIGGRGRHLSCALERVDGLERQQHAKFGVDVDVLSPPRG